MSGKVNSTGARSGVVGTTVGTPAGGKVVQYVPGDVGTGTEGTTSTSFIASPEITNTITFTAGNYIYAMGVTNIHRTGGGVNIGCSVQMSTNANDDSDDMFRNITVHFNQTDNNENIGGRVSEPLFGRIQPSGTAVTVTMKFRVENGGTSTIYRVNNKIDLWEVQA